MLNQDFKSIIPMKWLKNRRRIFISYSHADSAIALLIHTRLIQEFGFRNVIIDVRTFQAGDDWVKQLETELKKCTAVVVIIGRDWLSRVSKTDQPGFNPIRAEVSIALKSERKIIPVLVDNSTMPSVDILPVDLRNLVRIHYLKLHESRIDDDLNQLIGAIRGRRIDQSLSNIRHFFKLLFSHFIIAFIGSFLTALLWYLRVGKGPQPQGLHGLPGGYILLLIPACITALFLTPTRHISILSAFLLGVFLFLLEIFLF